MASQQTDLTSRVYGLIRDGLYTDAIFVLQLELQEVPDSRAALSLLAYCHYQLGAFDDAADLYGALVELVPGCDAYRLHYAQSLYKAAHYEDAATQVEPLLQSAAGAGGGRGGGFGGIGMGGMSGDITHNATKLMAAVRYEQNDIQACYRALESMPPEDPDVLVNHACLKYREGLFDEARAAFADVQASAGRAPDLRYNEALCLYRQKQHAAALRLVADVIGAGVAAHPELGVGSSTAGVEVRSVGNSRALADSFLVEAFNLRAALELAVGNARGAAESMSDMPPRAERELDPVTLHNQALLEADTDSKAAFERFKWLLFNPPFPKETFANLLLLLCKQRQYAEAAEEMDANPELRERFLNKDLAEYLDALVARASSPAEAYARLDALASRHVERLRRLKKQAADARAGGDADAAKHYVAVGSGLLQKYMPVVMGMAAVYWDLENYARCQSVLAQAAEFCSEEGVWRLNMAHVLYMQEQRHADAARLYEPLVRAGADDILEVQPVVLANLCVSRILASDNRAAEALMARVEEAEEREMQRDPSAVVLHSAIVNLVIGTLYCSKGNFEFGLNRVVRALDPLQYKLGATTWYYAKRCVMAALDCAAKHMVALKDASVAELYAFLDSAEAHGRGMPSEEVAPTAGDAAGGGGGGATTIAGEARILKATLMRMLED